MKNYAAIFIILIFSFMAVTGPAAGQEVSDQYFADQVKLSKPKTAKIRGTLAENMTAPANDDFVQAENVVLSNGSFNGLRNNISATKEQSEPAHADNPGGSSVWFNLTPTITQTVRIQTTAAATDFDTTLAVYTGDSLAALTPVGYNDDCYAAGCGTTSMIDLQLKAGTTYRIAIDGYFGSGGSTATGSFVLFIISNGSPVLYNNLASAYDLGTTSVGAIAGTNNLATGEPGEPGAYGGPGGKSVWYRYRSFTRRAMTFEMKLDFSGEIAVYSSPVANPTFAQLSNLDANASHFALTHYRFTVNFFADPALFYFVVVDHNDNSQGPETGNFQLRFFQTRLRYSMREYGPAPLTSVTVFRPSDQIWYSLPITSSSADTFTKFGLASDVPVPADYDGDALTNYAVTRSQGGLKHWYVLQQGSTTDYYQFQWGLDTDIELTGDFDRDGRCDAAVIRKVNGKLVWYVRQSTNLTARIFNFGLAQDRPVVGDFDGDRGTEIAVVRAEGNGLVWYILRSGGNAYEQTTITQFGIGSDLPAVEDYDGDGRSDIAVYRPSTGTWYILRSSTGEVQVTQFGLASDKPQPGDYDGDGKGDIGVFRPSTGGWHFLLSADTSEQVIYWGKAGDIPVSSMARFSLPEPDE